MNPAGLLYRRSLLTILLYPVSLLYSVALLIRRQYYKIRPGSAYNSKTIVISVGNLVMGGSGKTPFTIFLAELIRQLGYQVAVSHRGYKGQFEHKISLIANRAGLLPNAEGAGDEPLLIAQYLKNIPVIVGKNRTQAVKTLEGTFPDLDFIILDDSFQHLKVRHDYDFILLKENDAINNISVFPAGLLREPLVTLKYADTIVRVNKMHDRGESGAGLVTRILKTNYMENKEIRSGHFRIKGFYDIADNQVAVESLQGSRIALLSAIGQPGSFEDTVAAAGLSFIHHYTFPDHYHFNDNASLSGVMTDKDNSYDVLLTTEKDLLKLRKLSLELPLIVVKIAFEPDNRKRFQEIIVNLHNKQKETSRQAVKPPR